MEPRLKRAAGPHDINGGGRVSVAQRERHDVSRLDGQRESHDVSRLDGEQESVREANSKSVY